MGNYTRPRLKQFALSFVVGMAFVGIHASLTTLDVPHLFRVHLITAVMGMMGFLLTWFWRGDCISHKRHKAVAACMLHHINNAVTVITQAEYLPEDKRVEAVNQQLARIRWALGQVEPWLEGEIPVQFDQPVSGH